jgi:hypothetical protein
VSLTKGDKLSTTAFPFSHANSRKPGGASPPGGRKVGKSIATVGRGGKPWPPGKGTTGCPGPHSIPSLTGIVNPGKPPEGGDGGAPSRSLGFQARAMLAWVPPGPLGELRVGPAWAPVSQHLPEDPSMLRASA